MASSQGKVSFVIKFLHLETGRAVSYETEPMMESDFIKNIETPIITKEGLPIVIKLATEEISGQNYRTRDRLTITKEFLGTGCIFECGVKAIERKR